MASHYEWCPHKACDGYKAPEQLCRACAAVRAEIKREVEMALNSERRRVRVSPDPETYDGP